MRGRLELADWLLEALLLYRDQIEKLVLEGFDGHLAVPVLGLLLDELLDQRHHVGIGGLGANSPEVSVLIADLVAITKRPKYDALAAGLQHHRALAAGQDKFKYVDHLLRRHRVADHRESFLTHGVQLVVFKHDEFVLPALLSFHLVAAGDLFTGHGIDVVADDAVLKHDAKAGEGDKGDHNR